MHVARKKKTTWLLFYESNIKFADLHKMDTTAFAGSAYILQV